MKNPLACFFAGIILLGVGLFLFSQKVVVYTAWYTWTLGGFSLHSGLTVVPLIIGIIWLFCNPKSLFAKIVLTLGAIFIVITVIMSVSMRLVSSSLFDYILILGFIAAGSGLLLRALFKNS